MFKLLIIDDEDNTREGIAERICWNEIGISCIEQANDGVNALKKAVDFKPDIILTDVRMPRMDGIELSFKLREIYPECVIIFMSGYADKIYLKSAIQLKAVSYLEKPINLSELNQAVKDAVQMCIEVQKKKETEHSLASSISLVKSELTLMLLKKNVDSSLILQQIKAARLDIPSDPVFATLLIRIFPIVAGHSVSLSEIKSSFDEKLHKLSLQTGVYYISAFKDDHSIIVHLFADSSKKYLLTPDKLKNMGCEIAGLFEASHKYFISIGKQINGVLNVYQSYESAVSAIKKAFFQGYNCIVAFDQSCGAAYRFETKLFQSFKLCIEKQSLEQTIFFIKRLTSELKCFKQTPLNSVREFYFRLLLDLCKSADNLQIPIINDNSEFFKIKTLDELEHSLICYVEAYYRMLEEHNSSNRIINMVTAYIKENYQDEDLSITKISDYIHLAPTYLCSQFKEKTGKTINQYTTEFRVEKSKELLMNTKYKISDVTSMVGLRDQGYFTKLFRKTTGMTPKEFIINKEY